MACTKVLEVGSQLGGDGVLQDVIGRCASPPGIAIEEGTCLFEIGRMEVAGTKAGASRQREIKEVGSGSRNLMIVEPQPSSSLEDSKIRERQQVGGGAQGP